MRIVRVNYNVSDNCGSVTTVLSVTSNEDQLNDPEEDETGSDYQVIDNHTVKLRASRSGSGNGRIYTITITATDPSGNVSTKTLTVLVPHDRSEIVTSSPASPAATSTEKMRMEVAGPFEVTALHNPSKNQFTLVTTSDNDAPVQLRVTDNSGRVIETKKGVPPNGTSTLGQRYSSGIYFVEVIQGSKRVVLKLIKQ
jgi:membrane-bound inhibitor of C-type lysozyme